MRNYLTLLDQVYKTGVDKPNRTGSDARSTMGLLFEHNMVDGFPLLTTKKIPFSVVVGELIGFIRGCDSAEEFRELGAGIWDQNANENEAWLKNPHRKGTDDLGRIYGVQWRMWRTVQQPGKKAWLDQLATLVMKLRDDPNDRRMIVSAWNPGELDQMALPPCHMLFQMWADPENKLLSMSMVQRSCDMFLGVPFNIASYGLLLSILANMIGYAPSVLKIFLIDAHIYHNHFEQVREQLGRAAVPLPTLKINRKEIYDLDKIEPQDFLLLGYNPDSSIAAPMAV